MDKNEIKSSNSVKIILTIGLIVLALGIIMLLLLKPSKTESGQNNNGNVINQVDDLAIGETKYLEFLWMIDGAFNNERYNNEDFSVNGKTLEKKPNFYCTYDENKKTCTATNFEENYHKLFASNLKMDSVYGDGVAIKWYDKIDGVYTFTNVNSCDAGRMSTKQKMSVVSSTENRMVYKVTYEENLKSGIYQGLHEYDKEFVLIKENDTWKVSEAYYHNPCYMEYTIK